MPLITPQINGNYVTATRCEGSHIFDSAGNSWIDGASGSIACSIGHAHPMVVKAMSDACHQTSFVYRTQFSNPEIERLSSRLCEKLGYAASFFVNSGSEAVETAIRSAQQYWRERGKATKTRILSRRLSYHGSTIGSLSLSGHWPRRRLAGPLYGEPTQPTPYPYRAEKKVAMSAYGIACANELERELQQLGADNIAAFILEPIVGASGAAIVPPAEYIQRIRDICDRYDLLLIADEVLTGLGRTGRWLAMEHFGVKADLVCLGKGLNAGYFPISAVLFSADVYDHIANGSGSFELGHTHSNHPIGAAVGNAVLDVLEQEKLVERAEWHGEGLKVQLQKLCSKHTIVGEVRGEGMLIGIELVDPTNWNNPFPAELSAAKRATQIAFENGLVIYPSSGFAGVLGGDAIIIAPPFKIPEQATRQLIDKVDGTLGTLSNSIFQNRRKPYAA